MQINHAASLIRFKKYPTDSLMTLKFAIVKINYYDVALRLTHRNSPGSKGKRTHVTLYVSYTFSNYETIQQMQNQLVQNL